MVNLGIIATFVSRTGVARSGKLMWRKFFESATNEFSKVVFKSNLAEVVSELTQCAFDREAFV